MSEYTKKTDDFMKKFNVKMKVKFLKKDYHFDSDTTQRNIYRITIKRDGRQFSVKFGSSLVVTNKNIINIIPTNKNIIPTNYDVLACLTKYDIGDFDDFCNEFGYDNDSISALKTFKACEKEYKNVEKLFSDCMEELQEIC